MRTKLSMFVLGLVLALVLSACGPALSAQPRTLDVSGNGTVYLTPDIAYLYIGVHTEEPAIATAVSNNNTQTTALVDALKNAGVAEVDIQTSNFSVYSTQSYDKMTNQPSGGTTYAVDNTVYVTVRDLTKLGSLLNTAVEAGANNINSITFDVADKTAAMTQARQKAMANASSLASELAQTAGVQLAEIQNVSYSDNSPNPYSYGMGGGGGAAAPNASVPIQPGLTQITVTVSVTYSIK
ncbi:MAG: SIMPL domain-containing protein [Chloroflexi bacterium]|nr:SIMPL domain-containing protein [Chloroflexota bacterium]